MTPFIIYVNGRMVQAIDHNHTYVFLGDPAKGGAPINADAIKTSAGAR